jgi:hypothetical protein
MKYLSLNLTKYLRYLYVNSSTTLMKAIQALSREIHVHGGEESILCKRFEIASVTLMKSSHIGRS